VSNGRKIFGPSNEEIGRQLEKPGSFLAWTLPMKRLALRASDVCPPAPSQVGDVGPGQAALDQERAQELVRRWARLRADLFHVS
jgi:hypothetical protein